MPSTIGRHDRIIRQTMPWPSKKYTVIYADPPWNYNRSLANGAAAKHYTTQENSWLLGLPVANIADDTSALFLWATMLTLPLALQLIDRWGFRYSTCAFTWIKLTKDGKGWFMGTGAYTRANAELCLLGAKGTPTKLIKDHSVRQLVATPIGPHSEKPPEVRDRIVQLLGDVPRIELFARHVVRGWDHWGNEVGIK